MAYVAYTNLHTPNEVLEAIADYVDGLGYTIVANCVDDLDIYQMSGSDGKKLVFYDRTHSYFYLLRSCNGVNIFGITDDASMDIAPKQTGNTYGIGMTISEGYSSIARWYNQYKIPLEFNNNQVVGVYLPVSQKTPQGDLLNFSYTLFCNNVYDSDNDADTLSFTVMKEDDSYRPCAHLIFGTISKYDSWVGGAYMSASANYRTQETCQTCFNHDKTADSVLMPVMSSGISSSTFLRADIDGATAESRHSIYWASSGTDNLTGKKLSLPIRDVTLNNSNGNIPNYKVLQSAAEYVYDSGGSQIRIHSLDWGRNVNTLNCLSINYPLYFSVSRDPDAMSLYSAVGQAVGIYFVNLLNMQTGYVYKLNYPSSVDNCQVFPMGHRRGMYGYDGISLKQEEESPNA